MKLFTETPLDDLLSDVAGDLCKEKEKAAEARKQAGLDAIWQKAREQYAGIDEVNRKSTGGKARTLDGPVSTTMGEVRDEKRSTVFVNITRPYTNAGTAKVADILLPAGNKDNWDLKPTPVSEVAILQKAVQANPALLQAMPPPLAGRVAQDDAAREASIKVAKTLIRDWLIESKWHSETRTQITEAGKVGTGVLCGPFPKLQRIPEDIEAFLAAIPLVVQDPKEAEIVELELRNKLLYQPAGTCIPVENLFPDMPGCGSDIHNGRFVWEMVPDITKTQLQDMKKDPNYFGEQLDQVLLEDPKPALESDVRGPKPKSYTLWKRTGELDLNKLGPNPENEDDTGARMVFVQVELINGRIVKINQLPLDRPRFPYHILVWEPRFDSWAGIGIPEQIETPQRGLNASVRAGNDNLRWSVGFQVLIREGLIEPFDGEDWDPEAYKKWRVTADSLAALTGSDIDPRKAFDTIEFPNHLDKILPWIDFWLQMAESTTGLPLMFQGQKSSDSVGVSQNLMNNATTNLRMFIKHWDDDNCAPFIQRMYEWVQKYGPPEAKGDAVAHALGSSTLITKELQQQALTQMLDRTVQPVYGKSPAKTMDMLLEGFQIDPRTLDLDEEERQRLEAAQSEPDPKVQVAQIEGKVDMMIEQMRDERERWEAMLDAQMKGLSIEQADDAVTTQAAANISQEVIKQDGAAALKTVEAGKKPNIAQAKLPPSNPTAEESVKLLGLG